MGVGMMDAKRALIEAGGDFDEAAAILRTKGLAEARKRSDRAAGDGAIGYYLHQPSGYPTVGVLVELSAETDFVAKSDEFQEVAHLVALHIAARRPRWVSVEDVPEAEIHREKEIIAKQAANEGKPADVIPRIVEGRIKAFYEDTVLYEQEFINAERFEGTIGEMVQQLAAKMGENIGVKRFARLAVGEQDA
jgi:elongation factor Ts